jgi:hypothetical protein
VTPAPPAPEAPGDASFDRGRLLPWLAALAALLPDLAAAWPSRTYYFRDFSVTFYPLRAFAARELAAGRWPVWNPYIYEGSFALPVVYPPDLLHALWPSPVAVSWILTLHLPLAALTAYWLARELGTGRAGAFVAGVVYALGGLALSSLNLYVFLQALALAPLVVGTLRRAAALGGRAVLTAAVVVALALSTLAVEFVAQALLLGLALGLAARPRLDGLGRLALAGLLGAGLAGVPVALTLGIVGDSVRGAGFGPDVALANAVHPVVLLQSLVPDLFGALSAPVDAWWGGRFFSKGLPYFLSLYVGPLALVLAWAGGGGGEARGRRAGLFVIVIVGAGLLGLWYALGSWGGLAPLLARLPFLGWMRFPSKALLLPHLAVALMAGLGADRLRRNRGGYRAFRAGAVLAALGLALALAVRTSGPGLAAWASIDPARFGPVRAFVARGFLASGLLALFVVLVGLAVRRGRVGAGLGTVAVGAALVADLVRAGAGMNPQAPPSFFAPLPEMAALHLSDAEGGRLFSYGLDHSPAFREFLARDAPARSLASFFVNRQILAPYNNVVDRVEAPEATDLTSFVPRPRELGAEDYDPQRASALMPWFRNAAVTRVLSLDPLEAPDLVPLAAVPLGPPGLVVHVYRVGGAWPRAFVACRAVLAKDRDDALARPYEPGFDPNHEVALEGATLAAGPQPACRDARVRHLAARPDEERFLVELDGPGYVVSRASFARGWTAWVDGLPVPVLRANGKHRAVPVPAGAHEVRLRYRPPGLGAGLAVTVVAALGGLAVWASGRKEPT